MTCLTSHARDDGVSMRFCDLLLSMCQSELPVCANTLREFASRVCEGRDFQLVPRTAKPMFRVGLCCATFIHLVVDRSCWGGRVTGTLLLESGGVDDEVISSRSDGGRVESDSCLALNQDGEIVMAFERQTQHSHFLLLYCKKSDIGQQTRKRSWLAHQKRSRYQCIIPRPTTLPSR